MYETVIATIVEESASSDSSLRLFCANNRTHPLSLGVRSILAELSALVLG